MAEQSGIYCGIYAVFYTGFLWFPCSRSTNPNISDKIYHRGCRNGISELINGTILYNSIYLPVLAMLSQSNVAKMFYILIMTLIPHGLSQNKIVDLNNFRSSVQLIAAWLHQQWIISGIILRVSDNRYVFLPVSRYVQVNIW